MRQENNTTSKPILFLFLFIMAGMIITGIIFYSEIKELLIRSSLYPHALFTHIFAVTLFFANAVVGILWEARSLASGRKDVILHTYNTVAWLDARFSSPLIIISVISGIMLTLMYGDIWRIGWLSLAFFLFIFSGIVWVLGDIPSQYKIKTMMSNLESDNQDMPEELIRLLKMRLWISLAGVLPLIVVFILMVYKPEIKPLLMLFQR